MSDTTNQSRSTKREIEEFLGLNRGECEIEEDGGMYIIKPNIWEKELQIHTMQSLDDESDSKIYLFHRYTLTFEYCVFECEIELKETTINNKISFKNCTFRKPFRCVDVVLNKGISCKDTIFMVAVSFIAVKAKFRAEFSACEFKKEMSFSESIFYGTAEMANSVFCYVNINTVHFQDKVNFSKCNFKNEVDFSKSIFSQKADFTQTIFKASAYFDWAKFKGKTIFIRSEFCKNAHFYQTEFSENLDFFQAMFNEYLNLTGTTIFNFNFEQIKFLIEQESEKIKKANEFRDIFKNIKNALIKSGNLLGASRFRKMELYCKEIELDLKKKENRETSIRDFVDKIQLMFYRLTSDHHTDLLLILNNLAFLIVWFSFIAFILFSAATQHIEHTDINCIINGEYSTCKKVYSLSTIFPCYLCENWASEKGWAYVACFTYIGILMFTFIGSFIVIFIFMIWYFYTFTNCNKDIKYWSAFLCFVISIILYIKPALILPIFGKLIDESLKIDFPAFTSLSIVYAILMFLLIWSLQKTARKNTIVPN